MPATHSQGQQIRKPSGTESCRWRKIKQESHTQTPGSLRGRIQAENGESGKGNNHRWVLRTAASEPGMETIECPSAEAQTALKASPLSILEHLGVQKASGD